MYTMTLSLVEKNVALILCEGAAQIAAEKWVDNNDLLEQFFPQFDAILESHGLSVQDISGFALETDLPTGYTTQRIAQTIVNALNFVREHEAC